MSNMVLNSYTFPANPSKVPVIQKDLSNAVVKTYSSAAYFSWGAIWPGKEIELEWNLMSQAQYDQLATIFYSDASVVWDPQNGSGKTYNVRVLSLDGVYLIAFTGNNAYRKDVKMRLFIESEI